jgi:signal transduction histidine kinase
MRSAAAFARLERIVRRLALTVAVLTALAVPLGFGFDLYMDEVETREFQARLAADRIGQYAYVQGPSWRFSGHRISELVAFVVLPDDPASVLVSDWRGGQVAQAGAPQDAFVFRVNVPIIASAEIVGSVTVAASLEPLFAKLGLLMGIGIALGAAIYGCVHRLPLRALRSTMASLAETQNELRAQVARTEAALEIARSEQNRSEQASRMKSEFLANMSHELRTPLNGIIGFSDLMQMQAFGALNERYRSYSEDINKCGNHLLKIINDILDVAKIEAGRLTLEAKPIDLDDLLGECAGMLQPQAESSGVALTVVAEPYSPRIVGDRVKLQQVLLNLLSNAIKFTPRGGTVTAAARDGRPGWAEMVVADTGIGMTSEEIALAFQPFRQVDNSHTRKYQGTGLGLTLARALTKLHHGALDVSSEPGRGTTVTVRLPIALPFTTLTDDPSAPGERAVA